ncbi:MAG: DUF3078 domain-containing protein [Bacteroidales bacterium]|nr:DUF3078 domain-containing protein [Bacteroidales bacterium]MCF8336464.1 DUF3078 domain-containing protein [Bacteroidales bacterium]
MEFNGEQLQQFYNLAIDYGMRIIIGIIILIIGFRIIKWISKVVRRKMEKKDLDHSLQSFLKSLISITLKILLPMYIYIKTNKMKQILILATLLFALTGLQAQEDTTKYWETGTSGDITFSQTSLTNWAAGGEDSYSANALFKFYANYKKNKSSWENNLTMGYGFVKIIDDKLKKSTDEIDFQTKYGHDLGEYWNYSALFNFKSQFTKGYRYPADGPRETISDFMAPGYFILSMGMDYKPVENLSIFLSPITGKTTTVFNDSLSDAGAFGVEPGDKFLNEYGGYVKMVYSTTIMENVNLQTKVDLFSGYNNQPENIDVDWDFVLNMKANQYFSANLHTRLVYDHDTKIEQEDGTMAPKLQFKEVFGFGISYSFPEKK